MTPNKQFQRTVIGPRGEHQRQRAAAELRRYTQESVIGN